jgi:hypothetical protein
MTMERSIHDDGSANATTQYRPLTDESEDASGDNIIYADESEWADGYEDDEPCDEPWQPLSSI